MRKIENLKVSLVMFFSSLFKSKTKSRNLKEMEFSTSTQKMGIGFTDKIRDIFRRKWIRKAGK